MKVRDLVDRLQLNYLPDDELIVDYWDKATIESYNPGMELTDEQFQVVASRYEDGEYFWQSQAADTFVELAEEVIEEDEG
jgi:hypothetical protein